MITLWQLHLTAGYQSKFYCHKQISRSAWNVFSSSPSASWPSTPKKCETDKRHICIMSGWRSQRWWKKVCFRHIIFPSHFDFYSARIRLSVKINDEYSDFKELPPFLLAQQGAVGPARPKGHQKAITAGRTFLFTLFHINFCLIPYCSCSRYIAHDSVDRQNPRTTTVYPHFFIYPFPSAQATQNDTYHKTNLPCSMETRPRHIGPFRVGP